MTYSFDDFLTEGLAYWLRVDPPRTLSPAEEAVISKLLAHEFKGSEHLRRQLPSVRVLASGRGRDPSLKMSPTREPSLAAAVIARVPVEARGTDAAGNDVMVVLHVIDGFLGELEIIGSEGQPVGLPAPETLTVY